MCRGEAYSPPPTLAFRSSDRASHHCPLRLSKTAIVTRVDFDAATPTFAESASGLESECESRKPQPDERELLLKSKLERAYVVVIVKPISKAHLQMPD